MAMLKAQLLKHLLRIPSDRRLALRLKHDRTAAKACGFKKHTPSHSLFTHFRHRLGQNTYNRIFNQLLRGLLEDGGVKGDVIAVDSTHVDAYSQRASDNRTGKCDPEARVGRGSRGFILGYRVHTACCVESEMPLAFTVAPCNENDKVHVQAAAPSGPRARRRVQDGAGRRPVQLGQGPRGGLGVRCGAGHPGEEGLQGQGCPEGGPGLCDSWGTAAGGAVQGTVERGTAVRQGEGVAAAGLPQAQRP